MELIKSNILGLLCGPLQHSLGALEILWGMGKDFVVGRWEGFLLSAV
jgi:hypothetical protein